MYLLFVIYGLYFSFVLSKISAIGIPFFFRRRNSRTERRKDKQTKWTEVTSIGGAKARQSITSSDDGMKVAAVVLGGNIWAGA